VGAQEDRIPECEVDLRVGGRIYIVMEAGEGMGKYRGTRWPLEGTFTHIEPQRDLVYDVRSWTEGEQDRHIEHVNELDLSGDDDKTGVNLRITINEIGSGRRWRPSV
jgi:hypothetical protein